MLQKAKQMLSDGKDSEQIRKATGWFKGYDGKWRYEIDDSKAELSERNIKIHYTNEGDVYRTARLEDVIKHDELFKAYPQLKDYTLIIQETEPGVQGSFFKRSNQIVISQELFKRVANGNEFIEKKAKRNKSN